MKQAKTLYFYIEKEDLFKNTIKLYVAVFTDIYYHIEENYKLFLYKNKEYIGLFDLNKLKMEVEE